MAQEAKFLLLMSGSTRPAESAFQDILHGNLRIKVLTATCFPVGSIGAGRAASIFAEEKYN